MITNWSPARVPENEEIRERLGVQSEEEIEIEDYELPFPLEGNTRLWEINALCRMVQGNAGNAPLL